MQKNGAAKGVGTRRGARHVQESQKVDFPTPIPGAAPAPGSPSPKGDLCKPQPPAQPLQSAPVLLLATPDGPGPRPSHKPSADHKTCPSFSHGPGPYPGNPDTH